MAKQFSFSFIRPLDMSPDMKVFIPVFENCNLAVLCFFCSNVYFLAEWSLSPCQFRTGFSVDDDTLHTHFTRCFAFVLGLRNTFISRTLNRLLPECHTVRKNQ